MDHSESRTSRAAEIIGPARKEPDVGEPGPSGGGRRAAPPSVAFVTVR